MSRPITSYLASFFKQESTPGIVLIVVSLLALIVANSPWASDYFSLLHLSLGPLALEGWVNDVLMAVFFLMVGLEIKREMVVGDLSSWSKRILPGIAAIAGMAVPAILFVMFNRHDATVRGWAIPSATDIAFSLGIVSLLGSRVPRSLKLFLMALAIIDDLGAVIVIGIFYTPHVEWLDLLGMSGIFICLIALNFFGVKKLLPYLILGVALWLFTYWSGVHPTLAGVLLAMTIPLGEKGVPHQKAPLYRLEHGLSAITSFVIVPLFAFANAGVDFIGLKLSILVTPVTLGIIAGLVLGKTVGVFGIVNFMVKVRLAKFPHGATQWQMLGVSLLCGIGFTMSLFISLLAFDQLEDISAAKIGILLGSFVSGIAGYCVLRLSPSHQMKGKEG